VAAEKEWAASIHQSAKIIKPDEAGTEDAVQAAADDRSPEAFTALMADDDKFYGLLRAVNGVIQEHANFKPYDEDDLMRHEAEYHKATRTFNRENVNWKIALEAVEKGKNVNPKVMQNLRTQMRNRPLQYMEAYAVLMGDESWLPEENAIQKISRLDRGEEYGAGKMAAS
jgi:hypothetical protein